MQRRSLIRCATAAAAVGLVAALAPVAARATSSPGTTVLSGDVPHLAGAALTGHPAAAQPLHIGIMLQGQNSAGLAKLLAAGGRVTPDQFNTEFGATAAQGTAVRNWLTSGGLTVPGNQPLQGRYVLATGTVGTVSHLLGITFGSYQPAKGPAFIANIGAPTVPAGLGIVRVIGLNTSIRFEPTVKTLAAPISETTNPSDLWTLYNQPSANTGQGQKLATLLWGSVSEYQQAIPDLRAFEAANHLPQVPLTFVTQDAYVDPGAASDTLGSGLTETDVDVQASTGMAPGASGITLYEAQSSVSSDIVDAATKWVNDASGAEQLSGSFAGCETVDMLAEGAAFDSVFQQAEAEGRTVFIASGDAGAGCSFVANVANTPIIDAQYPATSPYVVAVGGTVVTEDQHTSPLSEYAWSGSGGGTSLYEPEPAWQKAESAVVGVCVMDPASMYNGTVPPTGTGVPCRGVPDVAAQSGDMLSGYNTWDAGTETPVTGTSLAAPLWQGMWARINAASSKTGGVGFAAPIIYKLGTGANYTKDFNDITVGDNGPYPATSGWDYVSGFGSPNVGNLMTDIDGTTAVYTPPAAPTASKVKTPKSK